MSEVTNWKDPLSVQKLMDQVKGLEIEAKVCLTLELLIGIIASVELAIATLDPQLVEDAHLECCALPTLKSCMSEIQSVAAGSLAPKRIEHSKIHNN